MVSVTETKSLNAHITFLILRYLRQYTEGHISVLVRSVFPFFFAFNTNLVMFNLLEGRHPLLLYPPALSPNKIPPLLSILLLKKKKRENKFPCKSEPIAAPKVRHTEVLPYVLHVKLHLKVAFSICPCLQAGCGHGL